MSKIIDIRFIKGRRAEAIEECKVRWEKFMKDGAIAALNMWKTQSSGRNNVTVEVFVKDHLIPELEKDGEKQRKVIEHFIEMRDSKDAVSLEKKILDMMNDGWSIKGEITVCSDKEWVQTMVRYDTVAVDLGFLF